VLLYDKDGEEFVFFEGLSEEVKSLLKLQISTTETVFIGPLQLQHKNIHQCSKKVAININLPFHR